MDSKGLYCYIDPISYYAIITLPDKSTIHASAKENDLGQVLLSTCNTYNLNTIHLFGNKGYLEGLKEKSLKNTNFKNIKIKINE